MLANFSFEPGDFRFRRGEHGRQHVVAIRIELRSRGPRAIYGETQRSGRGFGALFRAM